MIQYNNNVSNDIKIIIYLKNLTIIIIAGIMPGCDMERAPPEVDLQRPVRAHHRLDALQGKAALRTSTGCPVR